MNKKIIAISGYSCSGKSTLINQINEIYDCDIIKFGNIHKECVKKSKYQYAKDWIKEEGFAPYEKQLLLCFKERLVSIIQASSRYMLIDGIFSSKCFSLVRHINNIDLINIVLNANYNIRVQRMMERQKMDYEEAVNHLYTTDNIKQKVGLQHIINDFDYILDGNKGKEELQQKCLLVLQGIDYQHSKNNNRGISEKEEIERGII